MIEEGVEAYLQSTYQSRLHDKLKELKLQKRLQLEKDRQAHRSDECVG